MSSASRVRPPQRSLGGGAGGGRNHARPPLRQSGRRFARSMSFVRRSRIPRSTVANCEGRIPPHEISSGLRCSWSMRWFQRTVSRCHLRAMSCGELATRSPWLRSQRAQQSENAARLPPRTTSTLTDYVGHRGSLSLMGSAMHVHEPPADHVLEREPLAEVDPVAREEIIRRFHHRLRVERLIVQVLVAAAAGGIVVSAALRLL
jgi:hypothetical protein